MPVAGVRVERTCYELGLELERPLRDERRARRQTGRDLHVFPIRAPRLDVDRSERVAVRYEDNRTAFQCLHGGLRHHNRRLMGFERHEPNHEDARQPGIIKTIRGRGYLFAPRVTVIAQPGQVGR